MNATTELRLEGLDLDHGRGLDVLVAAKVLGLEVRQWTRPLSNGEGEHEVFDYWQAERNRWTPVKSYSTDDGTALRFVVPEVRRRGLDLSLYTGPRGWRAEVSQRGWLRLGVGEGTLAQAVCQASLEAATGRKSAKCGG